MGFLYVMEKLFEEVKPSQFGYRAVEENSLKVPRLKKMAKGLEPGEPGNLSFVSTVASIETIIKLSLENIKRRVLRFNRWLID